jgi:hypothetical protein
MGNRPLRHHARPIIAPGRSSPASRSSPGCPGLQPGEQWEKTNFVRRHPPWRVEESHRSAGSSRTANRIGHYKQRGLHGWVRELAPRPVTGADGIAGGIIMVEHQVKRVLGPECAQASGGISAEEGGGVEALGPGRAARIRADGRETRTGQDFAAAGAVTGPDLRGFAEDGARNGWRDGDGDGSGRMDADGHGSGMGDEGYQECGWRARRSLLDSRTAQ